MTRSDVYELDVQVRGWLVALLGWIMSLPTVHSRQMQGVLRNLAEAVSESEPR